MGFLMYFANLPKCGAYFNLKEYFEAAEVLPANLEVVDIPTKTAALLAMNLRLFIMLYFLKLIIYPNIPHIKIKYEFSMSFGYILNEN